MWTSVIVIVSCIDIEISKLLAMLSKKILHVTCKTCIFNQIETTRWDEARKIKMRTIHNIYIYYSIMYSLMGRRYMHQLEQLQPTTFILRIRQQNKKKNWNWRGEKLDGKYRTKTYNEGEILLDLLKMEFQLIFYIIYS